MKYWAIIDDGVKINVQYIVCGEYFVCRLMLCQFHWMSRKKKVNWYHINIQQHSKPV